MSLRRSLASLSLGAGLALACVSLTGCGSALAPTTTTSAAISFTGNWQLASAAASGTSSSITGILHADASNACIAANAPFEVSGSANKANLVTLTGPIANGKITITGTLAADGQSLTRPTYTVTGGSCAFTAPAAATAHVYSSISGNYAGSFSDPNGQVISITAALTQTPTSDTDGNFQLSGTGPLLPHYRLGLELSGHRRQLQPHLHRRNHPEQCQHPWHLLRRRFHPHRHSVDALGPLRLRHRHRPPH
jgi:hypothetical protein